MSYIIQNIDLIQKNRIKSAIVNCNNEITLLSAKISSELNLIDPILIGNEQEIIKICAQIKWDLNGVILVDSNDEKESSEIACQMASERKVELLVKGHMHTDVLMGEYIKSSYSLRNKGEKLSHIWSMTMPNRRDPLIITDGALNIKPSLQTKKMILKNVIAFSNKIKNFDPFISILSATEEVLPQMESSVDAKDLMEWALKEIDPNLKIMGPLAFDNSISYYAAKMKGIDNKVAGNANILLVPNIETGNSLVKMLVNFMDATAGGFVTGSNIPVVITSRSDSLDSRLSSISNAVLSIQ
jgi:phosphate acetyltransferase